MENYTTNTNMEAKVLESAFILCENINVLKANVILNKEVGKT